MSRIEIRVTRHNRSVYVYNGEVTSIRAGGQKLVVDTEDGSHVEVNVVVTREGPEVVYHPWPNESGI